MDDGEGKMAEVEVVMVVVVVVAGAVGAVVAVLEFLTPGLFVGRPRL